jgi:hypothetical protein
VSAHVVIAITQSVNHIENLHAIPSSQTQPTHRARMWCLPIVMAYSLHSLIQKSLMQKADDPKLRLCPF